MEIRLITDYLERRIGVRKGARCKRSMAPLEKSNSTSPVHILGLKYKSK